MPFKTLAGGRRLNLPRGATNTIQYLVKLDGTKATFECKAGHRQFRDFSKGPRSKRISAQALQMFRRYWGLETPEGGARGHCNGWCQKCQNEWDSTR